MTVIGYNLLNQTEIWKAILIKMSEWIRERKALPRKTILTNVEEVTRIRNHHLAAIIDVADSQTSSIDAKVAK